jgi:ATP-dependent helicase/nuclease subunit B
MNDDTSRVILAAFGVPAVEATASLIERVRASDPIAPITVVVPSNYSGLSLRRELGWRQGLINVRFMVAARLAELIAGGRVVGRKGPLTPALAAEAVRAALHDDPGPFGPVAGHVATARALTASFAELRQLNDHELEGLSATSGRAAHVVRLFRDVRSRTADFYDPEDQLEAAASVVDASPGVLRDIGHVVLFLPREPAGPSFPLWSALHRLGCLTAVLPLSGEAEVDADYLHFADLLREDFPPESETLSQTSGGITVLAAADPDEEVRNVIRLIGRELDADETVGVPLHRIAVLYPAADPYAAICSDLFAAARIPVNGPGDRTLASSLTGRAVRGLLSFEAKDIDRDAVLDFLSLPLVLPGGDQASASRWDLLSREAGVTRGLDNWRLRLAAHAARLAEDARHQPDEREQLANRLRADADACSGLLACIEAVASDARFQDCSSWAAFAGRTLDLLDRYLPLSRLPGDAEAEAHRDIRDAIEDLASLDDMGNRCGLSDFLNVVEDLLRRPWGRAGAFGDGVFIGPIATARGMQFDLVFLLGMVEGIFPRVPREDPLLPDHERAAVGALVSRATRRLAHDREDFLAAMASAGRHILCYPASSLRSQRKNLPSRWLLEVCSRLFGERIFSAEFQRLVENPASASWFESVPSLQSGLSGPLPPGSEGEFDLRQLLAAAPPLASHDLVRATPALARGLAAVEARLGDAFTAWDGFTGPSDVLPITAGRLTSPTRLESWSTCGFRYQLAHVLNVQPTREPRDELRMSPLDRGTLVHDILEEFFTSHGMSKPPNERWDATKRAAMRAIAQRHCSTVESAGIAGKPLLWRIEREQLLRELDSLLTLDEARREALGATFAHAEFTFGEGGAQAVVVPVEDGEIRFRGKIDRVDRLADGSIVIYDYKTGSDWGYKNLDLNPLDNGRRLQLPVYALAAQQLLGASKVHAAYWFVREDISSNPREFPPLDDPGSMLAAPLSGVAAGIAAGVFPARPGPYRNQSYENCAFCDYDRLCLATRAQAWRRKSRSPELRLYVGLVEADPAHNEASDDGDAP